MKGLLKKIDKLREWNRRIRTKWEFEIGKEYPCIRVELSLRIVPSDPDTKIVKFRDPLNETCYVFRRCPRSYEDGRNYKFMYKFRINRDDFF